MLSSLRCCSPSMAQAGHREPCALSVTTSSQPKMTQPSHQSPPPIPGMSKLAPPHQATSASLAPAPNPSASPARPAPRRSVPSRTLTPGPAWGRAGFRSRTHAPPGPKHVAVCSSRPMATHRYRCWGVAQGLRSNPNTDRAPTLILNLNSGAVRGWHGGCTGAGIAWRSAPHPTALRPR